MQHRKHILIVGPHGSGKSQRAQTLAREIAGATGGIRIIDQWQLKDAYGIDRAMHGQPAVLVVDAIDARDAQAWGMLARLSLQTTWTIRSKYVDDQRIVAPTMIVVCQRIPEWFCLAPTVWTVFEMAASASQEMIS